MKKCPFCKAEIEDNARFCLYCMKPLNEKEEIALPQKRKAWWLLILVTFLVAAGLTVILLCKNPQQPQGNTETAGAVHQQDAEPENQQATNDRVQPTHSADLPPEKEDSQPEQEQEPSRKPEPDTPVPSQSTQPAVTPEKTEDPEEPAEQETVEDVTTQTTEEPILPQFTEGQTEPETTPETVVYAYRTARIGDDFSAHYTNPGTDIVITGVTQPAENGIYDIPAYIDGQKVIAIMANAFYGSNAQVVYIPSTVKTIWNYAFNGCGLTDVYFRGSAIYAENMAFPEAFTLHCAADCHDRNLRYYKNSAVNYGATWQEWNG